MRLVQLAPVAAVAATLTACAPAPPRLLEVHVARFEFHGAGGSVGHIRADSPAGLATAALGLAEHANVRICIEALPTQADPKPVPIEIVSANETVGGILSRMVSEDPRYEYRERLGVIEILPVGADKNPADCLNMRIPILRVGYTWDDAFVAVKCEMNILSRNAHDIVLDPLRAGRCFPGGLRLSHPPPRTLRRIFVGKRVRDILDQLCSSAGNVAWYANYKGRARTFANLELGEYQPTGWYPVDPDDSRHPNIMMEGLPPKCTSCHYHSR